MASQVTLQAKTARIWVLVDDRAGNKSQVLGVARALGLPFDIKDITYTLSAALPNCVLRASFSMLTKSARETLKAPWPDILIAAGRRTAPVARHIKALSGGAAFLTQIMYPGSSGEDDFSLIAVPRHDAMAPADNRFEVIGAPSGVTGETLAEARTLWAGAFESLAKPHVALIVGGDTKRKTFTHKMARNLGAHAAALAKEAGGSLLITTSRRSTREAKAALLEATHDVSAHVFQWGDAGDNPYMGYLALADHLIVTGDSVSMCSEACATGKPVYIFAPPKMIARKHRKLHQSLYEQGCAKPLEDVKTLTNWSHKPLNPAAEIAAEMRRRLGL